MIFLKVQTTPSKVMASVVTVLEEYFEEGYADTKEDGNNEGDFTFEGKDRICHVM